MGEIRVDTRLTEDRLLEIEKRAAAATEGPWDYNSYSIVFARPLVLAEAEDCAVAGVPASYGDTATGRHAADADFIAAARQDVPDLIREVRRLRAALREVVDVLGPTPACSGCCEGCSCEMAMALDAAMKGLGEGESTP